MIKAQEAKSISISAKLNEDIINEICVAVISAASEGKYIVCIKDILTKVYPYFDPYINYLRSLGYSAQFPENDKGSIYLSW